MNENLNLVEILKDCPTDTKLYSTVFGDVTFVRLTSSQEQPICIKHIMNNWYLTPDGRLMPEFDGECTLFPSREERDWSKFKSNNEEFAHLCKFEVGDWVVNKFGDSWHIDSINKKNYQISNGKGNYNYFPISKQDEMYLWTIEDAKDGDVLALSWLEDKNLWEKIIIFKKYHKEGVKGLCSMKVVEGYGNTFKNGEMAFREEVPYYSKTWTCNLHPATKEQRDLLFQKIKEAGYKWNAETKTLEKFVKPKFKVGDKIVDIHAKYMGASVTQGVIYKITDDKYIFSDGSYTRIDNQDIWELVHNKKPKFDPKTLNPFDKVLARDDNNSIWFCRFFSHILDTTKIYRYYATDGGLYKYCIPYNDDTKHLVSKNDEAPEFYRFWED